MGSTRSIVKWVQLTPTCLQAIVFLLTYYWHYDVTVLTEQLPYYCPQELEMCKPHLRLQEGASTPKLEEKALRCHLSSGRGRIEKKLTLWKKYHEILSS